MKSFSAYIVSAYLLLSIITTPFAAFALSPGQSSNPRQQWNSISAYLDGSVIYGSDATRSAALRTFSGGLLKTSGANLLPLNDAGLANANDAHIQPDAQLFLAGDVRANENIELSAVHTLFVREHNLLAGLIGDQNPGLTDEQIYQRARSIVIAELQVITYKEFLPALLGLTAILPYTGYKTEINAGISNEFSTGAYRIGHTLINNDVEFLDNDAGDVRPPMRLLEAFFDPTMVKNYGPDPILKYLATDDAQEVDPGIIDDLRNFLFGAPGAGGLDLASLNIQRGRDHGLADYNTVRQAYGLPKVRHFKEISKNVDVQNKLKTLYGTVDNIDLWVGGLSEDHPFVSSVGPTFTKIIADQFMRIRDGDRFWYQRIFSGEALMALESTRLADVIRRNTTITKLQDNVFYYSTIAPIVDASAPLDGVKLLANTSGTADRVRSIDGSGNNQSHPEWGKAGIALMRRASSAYGDGKSTPAGSSRPSARVVSNMISAQSSSVPNSRNMSDWIYAWGQFIDHDLDLTQGGSESFNIAVPTGDPSFDPTSTGTAIIPLKRSNFDPATGV